LDERQEHIELVALFGALWRAPAGFDGSECGAMIFIGTNRSDVHASLPSKLRYGQSVHAVVFGMGADEFYEDDLPAEIKSSYQPIVASGYFESDTLAVEHLRFWRCSLNLVCRVPMGRADQFVPTFERHSDFRVLAPETDKRVSSNDPHIMIDSL